MTPTDPELEGSPGTGVPDGGQPVSPSSTAGGEDWQAPTVEAPGWLPPELDAPVLETLEQAPAQDAAYAAPSFGAAPGRERASTARGPRPAESSSTGRDLFAPPEDQVSLPGTLGARDVRGASAPLRVAAALLSVVIPGVGLFLRRQFRPGLIVLLGSIGCAAAGIGLAYAQDATDSVALAFASMGLLLAAVVLYLAGIVASAWPATGDAAAPRRTTDPITADAGPVEAKPKRRASLRRGSRREAPATSTETLLGLVIIVGVIVVVGGWLAAVVWLAVDGDWEAAGGMVILGLAVGFYLLR